MKDAVGQELKVGDRVAYIITDSYAGMKLIGEHAVQTGTVAKINPKTVELKDTSYRHTRYGYNKESGRYEARSLGTTRKVPHRVIKIS